MYLRKYYTSSPDTSLFDVIRIAEPTITKSPYMTLDKEDPQHMHTMHILMTNNDKPANMTH